MKNFNSEKITMLLEQALKNAEEAKYSADSLSIFETQVGELFQPGRDIAIYGRCTNGWDANNPKSLQQLSTINRSQFIRACRRICEAIYGADDPFSHVIYSNLYRLADCDAGNPPKRLRDAQYEECCEIFNIEQKAHLPLVSIFIVGNTFCQTTEWDSIVWDGYLNKIGEDVELLQSVVWETRENKFCSASIYKANSRYFLFCDRPEGHSLESLCSTILSLIDQYTELLKK